MKLIIRSRSALAAMAASFAAARAAVARRRTPRQGPELVQRSGTFTILHADGRDAVATRQWTLVDGLQSTPVRAPADIWIEPGSRVRLEGTMQNGALVLGDTLTAVTQLAPAQLTGGLSAAPSTETTAVVQFYFAGQTSGLPASPDVTMTSGPMSLRAYYLEQTYGDITFETTVFAPPSRLRSRRPPAAAARTPRSTTGRTRRRRSPASTRRRYKHIVYVFPAAAACAWAGLAEMPRPSRLDQRHVHGARDRARARSQPRRRARGRAHVHVVRRHRADGRHVLDRPAALLPRRAAAVRGSLRCDGQRARAAADEHGAQAGAGRPARDRDRDGQRLRHLPARAHGDCRARRCSCSVCQSPGAAPTSSSTGGRSASSTARRARPSRACSSTRNRPISSTRTPRITMTRTPRSWTCIPTPDSAPPSGTTPP